MSACPRPLRARSSACTHASAAAGGSGAAPDRRSTRIAPQRSRRSSRFTWCAYWATPCSTSGSSGEFGHFLMTRAYEAKSCGGGRWEGLGARPEWEWKQECSSVRRVQLWALDHNTAGFQSRGPAPVPGSDLARGPDPCGPQPPQPARAPPGPARASASWRSCSPAPPLVPDGRAAAAASNATTRAAR